MLKPFLILISSRCTAFVLACSVVTLAACGQKGALYLPAGPAATNRATLPQTLKPGANAAPAAPAASSPVPER